MHYITSQIILSGLDDVLNEVNFNENKVTHILTIDTNPLPDAIGEKYKTKFIQCEDVETTDLLHTFDECIDFIENALLDISNVVIIHCHAGQSRSVCILAAFLMKTKKISLNEAEDLIQSKKPDIGMNQGFIRQLLLFEVMGWKIDASHPGYKHYKLRCIENKINEEGINEITVKKLATIQQGDKYYKCKKCRKRLFGSNNVYPHTVDINTAFHMKFNDVEKYNAARNKCSSLFLEPMLWMQKDIIGHMSGKLNCPHCGDKLGKFNWCGSQCSCGKWVTPALQIHSSKLDFM